MRNILQILTVFSLLAGVARPAHAEDGASDWTRGEGSAVRMLPGQPAPDGSWRAGIEIRLEPGWKTYWRRPGDSGVPPFFDWSASTNLREAAVLWPAPHWFADGGGSSIGYKADIVLPIAVTPAEPGKPVHLALTFAYAVCSNICVPANADLSIDLTGKEGASPLAELVARHERAVPVRADLGAGEAVSVVSAALDVNVKPPLLTVTARAGADAELFVEGPQDWYLPPPMPAESGDPALRRFTLALDGLPAGAKLPGTVLRLTLADKAAAIEVPFTIP